MTKEPTRIQVQFKGGAQMGVELTVSDYAIVTERGQLVGFDFTQVIPDDGGYRMVYISPADILSITEVTYT